MIWYDLPVVEGPDGRQAGRPPPRPVHTMYYNILYYNIINIVYWTILYYAIVYYSSILYYTIP